MTVRISPPDEPDLDLVFDDGDNPPLDLRGVTAVFAELPWIYFEGQPGTIIARYGNARTEAPRYDLEAVPASAPGRHEHGHMGAQQPRQHRTPGSGTAAPDARTRSRSEISRTGDAAPGPEG